VTRENCGRRSIDFARRAGFAPGLALDRRGIPSGAAIAGRKAPERRPNAGGQ